MKNLAWISEQSRIGIVPLYYSCKEDAVYSEDGEGRFYLTDLIRYNSPVEVENTVRYILSL